MLVTTWSTQSSNSDFEGLALLPLVLLDLKPPLGAVFFYVCLVRIDCWLIKSAELMPLIKPYSYPQATLRVVIFIEGALFLRILQANE